ncbi:MAG TPA: helix-turn-helix transcriptional regulator [Gemmataceae bacterium]|nr:helix-turn-helix transcriptional regulator [Gemmataceae bacterium]
MTFNQQLGKRLKQYRLLRGLTQAQVAAKIGCSYQMVQKLESGINQVAAERLTTISTALAISPLDLLFDQEAFPEMALDRQDLVLAAALARCTHEQKAAIARLLNVFGVTAESEAA